MGENPLFLEGERDPWPISDVPSHLWDRRKKEAVFLLSLANLEMFPSPSPCSVLPASPSVSAESLQFKALDPAYSMFHPPRCKSAPWGTAAPPPHPLLFHPRWTKFNVTSRLRSNMATFSPNDDLLLLSFPYLTCVPLTTPVIRPRPPVLSELPEGAGVTQPPSSIPRPPSSIPSRAERMW